MLLLGVFISFVTGTMAQEIKKFPAMGIELTTKLESVSINEKPDEEIFKFKTN